MSLWLRECMKKVFCKVGLAAGLRSEKRAHADRKTGKRYETIMVMERRHRAMCWSL